MLVTADPDREFAAVNVTEYVPACAKVGVQFKVPLMLPAPAKNVAPAVMAEPDAVNVEIASPSGSEAATVKERSEPSMPETAAGAVNIGARSGQFEEITVDAEPDNAFAAVNITVALPQSGGVHWNVPDVFVPLTENVAPAGSGAAVSDVIASPSGSDAKTTKLIRVPGDPEAVAGAVMTGARSWAMAGEEMLKR